MDSNEIRTNSGTVVGHWDGKNVLDLQQELARIRREVLSKSPAEKIAPGGIPHREQLPTDLRSFTAYLIWGCDTAANCLCGMNANRVVAVDDVRRYSLLDHH
jgi:hypothetical protein